MTTKENNKRIALITGANQGVGFQVAKELVAHGLTVLLGSRNLERGEAAAREIGPDAIAIQLDVTDQASVTAAVKHIQNEFGHLDVLVQNAGISRKSGLDLSLREYGQRTLSSNVSLDEVRAVWETNVFGVLSVFQAMLPLLREAASANIVNVSSGVGSLTMNTDPSFPYRSFYSPVYAASKTALNAITLAMMIELENTPIKVRLVSPAFTKTNLNNYEGTESLEDGSREVARVALLGPEDPTGTFTQWENVTIPW